MVRCTCVKLLHFLDCQIGISRDRVTSIFQHTFLYLLNKRVRDKGSEAVFQKTIDPLELYVWIWLFRFFFLYAYTFTSSPTGAWVCMWMQSTVAARFALLVCACCLWALRVTFVMLAIRVPKLASEDPRCGVPNVVMDATCHQNVKKRRICICLCVCMCVNVYTCMLVTA